MHCIQIVKREDESVFSAGIRNSKRFLEDIDFETISIEKEICQKNFEATFLGDVNESTEIDSILESMTLDQSLSVNPFKSASRESTEIFNILRCPSRKEEMLRGMSRSNPEFYNKKISLQGKVIKSEKNLTFVALAGSPVRPRPERVSNPLMKIFNIIDNLKIVNDDCTKIKDEAEN